MRSVTDLSTLHGVSFPQEHIRFEGPPADLYGRVEFINTSKEPLHLGSMPLVLATKGKGPHVGPGALQVHAELGPGQRVTKQIRAALDATTPPGTYRMTATMGGVEKSIELTVLPHVHVEVHPSKMHFVGIHAGLTHRIDVLFCNTGNVPLLIPTINEAADVDATTLRKILTHAAKHARSGNATEILRLLQQEVKAELTSTVKVSLQESGTVVEAGRSLQLHFSFTLPPDVRGKEQFEGEVSMFNQKLSYRIVQAVGRDRHVKGHGGRRVPKTRKEK